MLIPKSSSTINLIKYKIKINNIFVNIILSDLYIQKILKINLVNSKK
jgi:hypothetical protein